MPTVTIRNLTGETHRALKQRAAKHGHGIEAEIRQILDDTVCSEKRLKIGTELAAFGEMHGGLNLKIERD